MIDNTRCKSKRSIKTVVTCLVLFACSMVTLWAEKKSLEIGQLKIFVDDVTGVFSIATIDQDSGNWISLLESSEHGTTSGFYVKTGNSVRKLANAAGVSICASTDETSATVSYTVTSSFVVDVRFEPFCVNDKRGYDSIRVDISIQNISAKNQVCSVKGVFDTWLGEQTDTHFVTASETVINTVRTFDSMNKAQFVRSSGRGTSVQFLLYGPDISVPDAVYIANRDALLQDSWIPSVKEKGTFDSIETYNNSALGVNWHQVSLSPQTRSTLRFYITTATGGAKPQTVKSLGLDDSSRITAADADLPTYTDSYGTTYTMSAITESQLDPEYINDLLVRIKELEKDSDNATRDEIRKLNAELDAIFVKLGQAAD